MLKLYKKKVITYKSKIQIQFFKNFNLSKKEKTQIFNKQFEKKDFQQKLSYFRTCGLSFAQFIKFEY